MIAEQLVAGRFEVSECVGSGGCGAVFRAWDRVLEREVAIKQLDRAIDERVMRTSRAAARLNHPAIVPLFEVGEHEGVAFLVSEYIDGLTLRQAHEQGLLTDRDVAEIGAELCAALHHAHERGVVHGDIKPENVIVRTKEANPDPRAGRCQAKMRDFATREILGADAQPTGPYLTPEQLDEAEPDPASDVFGLALILYECWTGRNPMAGASAPRIARIRGRHIPQLAELRPDLPARLTALIDGALDAEPSCRPDALELREWLDHVFADLDHELAVPQPVEPVPRPVPARAARLLALIAGAAGFASAYVVASGIDRAQSGETLWGLAPVALLPAIAIALTVATTVLISRAQSGQLDGRPVRHRPAVSAAPFGPPEPVGSEIRISAAAVGERPSRGFQAVRVP